MKRAILLVLPIILVLLAGCNGSTLDRETFENWREEYISVESHQIKAGVQSQSGDRVSRYTLLYSDGQEETVEILEPEQIAKIKAGVDDDNEALTFDGVVLATGDGLTDGLSPLMALPMYMEFLREGHTELVWTEKGDDGELLVSQLETEKGRMTIWIDRGDMSPVCAAITSDEIIEVNIKFM